MLKFYDPELQIADPRDPVKVLEKCVKDIREGRWTTGALTKAVHESHKKPRACALGMLALNSGSARVFSLDGQINAEAEYPYRYTDTQWQWKKSGLDALDFLYQALPPMHRAYYEKHYSAAELRYKAVYGYNDNISTNTIPIRDWFQKALELAKAAS